MAETNYLLYLDNITYKTSYFGGASLCILKKVATQAV